MGGRGSKAKNSAPPPPTPAPVAAAAAQDPVANNNPLGAADPTAPPPAPAAPPTPAYLIIAPHFHTVYCDRKRVVCTAEGAVRQGNRLVIAAPAHGVAPLVGKEASSPGAPEGVVVTWYRTSSVAAAYAESRPAVDVAVAAGPAGGAAVAAEAADGHPSSLEVDGHTLHPIAKRPAGPAEPDVSAPGLAGLPDEAPRAAFCAAVAVYGSADGAQHADSPLYSALATVKLLRAEAGLAAGDPLQFSLTLDDVGHHLAAVVTLPGHGTFTTPALGPVEAAPPCTRAIWLEDGTGLLQEGGVAAPLGESAPTVGGALLARIVYYGGAPGLCDVSWIRVDAVGDRSESQIVRLSPASPLGPAGEDGRVRVLGAGDVKCEFKACCDPVRSDGARGAPATSKACKEVVEA